MVGSYDYWLFDLDGTVVDVDPDYAREVFDEVGDRLGVGFTDRDVAVLWHGLQGSRDDYLRRHKGVAATEFWRVFHEVEDPATRAAATSLHADAEFVADLAVPVGVVTHCQRYLAEPALDHLDVRDWFDAVVCCDDDLGWKPDPAPVHEAIGRLSVDGDGVLAGDGPGDVGAAWNAGLDAVHVERHGPGVRGQCVLADHRVRSFADLDGVGRVATDGGPTVADRWRRYSSNTVD
jgi:phosphoglycolate phosphatase